MQKTLKIYKTETYLAMKVAAAWQLATDSGDFLTMFYMLGFIYAIPLDPRDTHIHKGMPTF